MKNLIPNDDIRLDIIEVDAAITAATESLKAAVAKVRAGVDCLADIDAAIAHLTKAAGR